jgi:hypothetical protein
VGADDHVEAPEGAADPGRVTGLVVVAQKVARALAQKGLEDPVDGLDRLARAPERP